MRKQHEGIGFSALAAHRKECLTRKFDEAMQATGGGPLAHSIYHDGRWTRCRNCPAMALKGQVDYWRSKPCNPTVKRLRTTGSYDYRGTMGGGQAPSDPHNVAAYENGQRRTAEEPRHSNGDQYQTTNRPQQGGSDSPDQCPAAFTCSACGTTPQHGDDISSFMCELCMLHLCTICGTYGSSDPRCPDCGLARCYDCSLAHECRPEMDGRRKRRTAAMSEGQHDPSCGSETGGHRVQVQSMTAEDNMHFSRPCGDGTVAENGHSANSSSGNAMPTREQAQSLNDDIRRPAPVSEEPGDISILDETRDEDPAPAAEVDFDIALWAQRFDHELGVCSSAHAAIRSRRRLAAKTTLRPATPYPVGG